MSQEPSGLSEALRRIEAAEEQDAVEQALLAARERLNMDAAYVSTIDNRQQTVKQIVGDAGAVGLSEELTVPVEKTYCARMIRGVLPHVVPDTSCEPALGDLGRSRFGAYAGVPIRLADGRVHGTLCCASASPREDLGEEEVRFMKVLADVVAARVEKAEGSLAESLRRSGFDA